jgi:hypothetical protein
MEEVGDEEWGERARGSMEERKWKNETKRGREGGREGWGWGLGVTEASTAVPNAPAAPRGPGTQDATKAASIAASSAKLDTCEEGLAGG